VDHRVLFTRSPPRPQLIKLDLLLVRREGAPSGHDVLRRVCGRALNGPSHSLHDEVFFVLGCSGVRAPHLRSEFSGWVRLARIVRLYQRRRGGWARAAAAAAEEEEEEEVVVVVVEEEEGREKHG